MLMLILLLWDGRQARNASIEQQQEMMNYMSSLNRWLQRDVEDRHNELQGLGDRKWLSTFKLGRDG